MTTRLLLIGDTHGVWHYLNKVLEDQHDNYDVAIQLGDFGYWPDMHHSNDTIKTKKPLYWIDGNHEHHHNLIQMQTDERRKLPDGTYRIGDNIFYIPRGTILDFDGYKILGVGGAYSIDKHMRTEGYSWFKEEEPNYMEGKRIVENKQPVDMIVSHTCPTAMLPSDRFEIKAEDSTCKLLEMCRMTYGPSKWYMGHWHIKRKENFDNCDFTFLSNIDYDYDNGWEIIEI